MPRLVPSRSRADEPVVRRLTLLFVALGAPVLAGCEGVAGPAGRSSGGASAASGEGGSSEGGGTSSASGEGGGASAASGEGGAPPLSACDERGSCTTEPTSCVSCSISEGACVAVFQACTETPDNACFELNACNGQCEGSESCLEACAAQHAAGTEPLEALLRCVWCDDCPASCAEFQEACGAEPPPDPGADACCKPHEAPGCTDDAVESCVCAADDYCCTETWDQFCVERVTDLSCGTC